MPNMSGDGTAHNAGVTVEEIGLSVDDLGSAQSLVAGVDEDTLKEAVGREEACRKYCEEARAAVPKAEEKLERAKAEVALAEENLAGCHDAVDKCEKDHDDAEAKLAHVKGEAV